MEKFYTEIHKLEVRPGRKTTVKVQGPEKIECKGWVILAHGSSNNLDHPLLTRVAEALAENGWQAIRFNFLYREDGRARADRKELLQRTFATVYSHARQHWSLDPARLAVGGKSLGARTAAQVVAGGLVPASALIYLGFPLHWSGRPQNGQDELLIAQGARPQLFFQGTHDPYCHLDRLESVLPRLTGPVAVHLVEGGNHSFRRAGDDNTAWSATQQLIAATTVSWLNEILP